MESRPILVKYWFAADVKDISTFDEILTSIVISKDMLLEWPMAKENAFLHFFKSQVFRITRMWMGNIHCDYRDIFSNQGVQPLTVFQQQ